MLVPVSFRTRWFQALFRSYPVCFLTDTLHFELTSASEERRGGQPLSGRGDPQARAVFLLGRNPPASRVQHFVRTFSSIGLIAGANAWAFSEPGEDASAVEPQLRE